MINGKILAIVAGGIGLGGCMAGPTYYMEVMPLSSLAQLPITAYPASGAAYTTSPPTGTGQPVLVQVPVMMVQQPPGTLPPPPFWSGR